MRHQKKTDKLGRKSDHRAALMSNVVASLIDNDRISTTLRIARSARRYADRMVTLAKKGTLHHRRLAIAFLRPSGQDRKETVQRLFDVLGPRFASRPPEQSFRGHPGRVGTHPGYHPGHTAQGRNYRVRLL